MKIFISQIYLEPRIKFYFSHHFQNLLGSELTRFAAPSVFFIEKYSEEFNVVFRLSAKPNLINPEIRGPTVFKKTKDVEFTIFIPHDGGAVKDKEGHRLPLDMLFKRIIGVLNALEIDTAQITQNAAALISQIVCDNDEKMFRF